MRKRRNGRIIGFIRWTSTVGFVITSAIWGLSYFRHISYWVPKSQSKSEAGSLLSPPGTWPYSVHSLQPGTLVFNGYGYSERDIAPTFWNTGLQRFWVPWTSWFRIMPIFPGPRGEIVIPLWLPFCLFGIPAALLWHRRFQQWRWATNAGRTKVIRDRFGRRISLALAALSIPFTLVVTPPLLGAMDELTGRQLNYISDIAMRANETAWLCGMLFFWFLAAYAVAIFVYRRARWKTCYIDAPFCSRCGYNLTGNPSGRCSECGTPVESTIAKPVEN